MRRRKVLPYQPALARTVVDVGALVEWERLAHFPELSSPVPAFFAVHEPLACAITSSEQLAFPAVYYHQVLNHPGTPVEVLRFIAKHELLHFVIPPEQRGRYLDPHPEAFWDAEQRIAPESRLARGWIWANLHRCLERRAWGSLRVTGRWREREFGPRLPWSESELQLYLQANPGALPWRPVRRRRPRGSGRPGLRRGEREAVHS